MVGCAGKLSWVPNVSPVGAGNPLPAIIHATLTPKQLGAGRIVIVGDVHGCLAELRELLAECEFQMGTDTLIFVGDLVNKGPSSAEVGGHHMRLQMNVQVHSVLCWSLLPRK